ncbi:GNAT family N-acetyltransferase [Chitinilyticum piscinae]|uniref:GNAT family N-acetyltransferase n=1 Tax=Chitinilyticum piscinae TaxID=2866724 RepID=A0A8J7FV96_9NEIS|nr:GNAT family N-acetyltransferase [Chitinilyticum piscinae]MBE9607880.1 GNAT family N-acetyltransferase [Chitinilyticum piscinae]
MTEDHVDPLTRLMTLSFDADALLHCGQEEGGPPGYNDGSFLRQWGLHPDATSFAVTLDEELVGALILWRHPDGNHVLGNMFVAPSRQGMGLGRAMWQFVENRYPDALSWATETPGFALRNHHFYQHVCGFTLTSIAHAGTADESWCLRKNYSPRRYD